MRHRNALRHFQKGYTLIEGGLERTDLDYEFEANFIFYSSK